MTDLGDVLDIVCAEGNFENRSTHRKYIFFLFPKLKVAGRQNLTPFLVLVLPPMAVFGDLLVFKEFSYFYLL